MSKKISHVFTQEIFNEQVILKNFIIFHVYSKTSDLKSIEFITEDTKIKHKDYN
jgi:hypothetical protein